MYSHKNLDFKNFETILKKERERVEKNLEVVKAEREALACSDEVGDFADITEIQIDNTTDQILIYQLEEELFEIDAALGRIKAGTYGICEKTAKPIPVERLMANPWARTVASR